MNLENLIQEEKQKRQDSALMKSRKIEHADKSELAYSETKEELGTLLDARTQELEQALGDLSVLEQMFQVLESQKQALQDELAEANQIVLQYEKESMQNLRAYEQLQTQMTALNEERERL